MWSYFEVIIIHKLLSESGANFLEAAFKQIKASQRYKLVI